MDQASLVARVKSMLRIKALHDTAQEQAARLEEQATQLAEWNHALEQRVTEKLAALERIGRLKRFSRRTWPHSYTRRAASNCWKVISVRLP